MRPEHDHKFDSSIELPSVKPARHRGGGGALKLRNASSYQSPTNAGRQLSVESWTLVTKNTSCLPVLLLPSLCVTTSYRACMLQLVTELVCYCWLPSLCGTAGYRACMSLLVTEFVCHCWLPSLYFTAGYRALCYCWLLNLTPLVTKLVCHC